MPTLAPYIPNRDTDFQDWATNFSTLLTASPSTYGLVAGDATAVDTVVDAFVAAFALVTSPATRTPVAVQAKNVARINAEAVIRPYAQQIALNVGVDTADKIAIGVNPRTSVPSPIAPPTTYPDLTLQASGPLTIVFRYRDNEGSPTSKAKPSGATQVQLFGQTSATVISDPAALPLLATVTKCPGMLEFDASDGNKLGYFAARFITRTGKHGPWSPIANCTVPAA